MKTVKELKTLAEEIFTLEKRGEYSEALDKLDSFDVDDIGDFELASELLLRRGALTGFRGYANQILGTQESSKDILTRARRRFVHSGSVRKIAECENYLALAYVRLGEVDEAINWCDEAFSHDLDATDRIRLHSIVTKSLILVNSARFKELLHFCVKYESQINDGNDAFMSGCFSCNFGIALKNEGRTIEAIDKYEASRAFHKISGHLLYRGTIENCLALAYVLESRFGDARVAAEKALHIFDTLGDQTRKGTVLETTAQIYCEEGKYSEALETINQSVEILEGGENATCLTEAYFTKAKILVFLDDVATATLALMKAVEIARTNVGEKAAEKLAKEFEIVIRKKSPHSDIGTHMQNKIYKGEMELVLPPPLSSYDDYQVVRIKNSHLEEIGIPKNSLAVVVEETIKRGDLIALTEITNDSIICGFYDYFAGIVSISGINSETLLFKTEEVKVVGKIIGVGNSDPDGDGKIHIRPIEI